LRGDVEDGQSGSPVYDSKATVIGIMKGVAGKATGAFVPVELAEQLIIPIRLRDLRREQEKLEARLKEPLVDDQVAGYIKGDKGSSALAGWLRQYLRSKEGAAVIEEEVDEFLSKNIDKVSRKLAKPMDVYMSNVVAYSYSMEFSFRSVVSGTKKGSAVDEPEWRRLSFYKTPDDTGELHCDLSYPPSVDNKVYYKINNRTGDKFAAPNALTENGMVSLNEVFDKDFKMYEPGSREEGSPFHKVVFKVEAKPFKGIITVQCTVMVIGSAKRRTVSQ
jgi:hypothetical protein